MPAPSVPYQIACMQDQCGISESNLPGHPEASVTFTCLASDHYSLIKSLIGYPVAAGFTIIRTYPFQYPPSPNLICTGVESVDFYGPWTPVPGVGLPWLWRKYAKVKAKFELPLYFTTGTDPSGLPYTTTTFQGTADKLTLPETTFTFPSGAHTNTPAALTIAKIDVTMLRHMMPYAPVPQAFAILGGVNNAAVTIGGFSCPTGTLLFNGFTAQPSADPTGAIYYDVEYSFSFREQPWNYFLSPNPTEGWALLSDGSGGHPFTPVDFSTLP